ncbi:helix-turn-helix transcriptional regulator [Spirochaetota bacterium]
MTKRLINVKELSDCISMPVYTIRKLVRQGILPAIRPTKRNTLFDVEDVVTALKKFQT